MVRFWKWSICWWNFVQLLGLVIKVDVIKTSKCMDVDVSKPGAHLQPVISSCKQHWIVSHHNLDCQCGPMILWSIYWVEVFTVWLFSLWLCLLSEQFIFPQHIHRLLVGLDFPPSGRLGESGLSWDYKDVLGTLLGIDSEPELACHCLGLSSASFSSPVFADDWWGRPEVPEVFNVNLCQGLDEDVCARFIWP